MNTGLPSIWSKQLSQEYRDKIAEDGLLSMAQKAVFEETGALNDIEISSLLLRARKMGKDGRKFLWLALNQKFGIPTPDTAAVSKQIIETGFKCPVCNKEFKSQAALSGHGITRCKG